MKANRLYNTGKLLINKKRQAA